jgi:hypothetical protein
MEGTAVKRRRQLLLRFRRFTQDEIDDLRNQDSELPADFEFAGGSTVLLASELQELTAALVFVERELARRGLGKTLH